jgi:antitoxin MazE
MHVNLIQIGNSKGIRLPKTVLQALKVEKELDIEVKDQTLIVKPVRGSSRQGWEEKLKAMHKRGEDKPLISDMLDIDNKEWEW